MIVEREGAVLGMNMGRPIVTHRCAVVRERRAVPRLLWEDLLLLLVVDLHLRQHVWSESGDRGQLDRAVGGRLSPGEARPPLQRSADGVHPRRGRTTK